MKKVLGFIAALLVTYVAGAIFISQGNIAQLTAHGVSVEMGDRLNAALHDVTNMYDLYLPLVGLDCSSALVWPR